MTALCLLFLLLPPALPTDGVELPPASLCALCHSNAPTATAMRDGAEREIAFFDLWSGSMMAHAAHDPFWRASVSAEVAATPARRTEIEAKCLSCHSPAASRMGLEDHGTGSAMHLLDCDSDLGVLARDGVSCVICHGIGAEGLGTEESFTAGFLLDGNQRLFGPHENPFAMPMIRHTGFTPTPANHLKSAALCGSCHTLETAALDADGEAVGAILLEQAPYLEWRNSAYRDEGDRPGPLAASCADCHLPTEDVDGQPIQTRIVRNPGGWNFPPTRPREPYGRHVFLGANAAVLSLLGEEERAASTREHLAGSAARVSLESITREDDRLAFTAVVENLAGHKLPSGHPSRRAWLCIAVRDQAGNLIFASGVPDGRGRILDADGSVLPSELAGGPIPPHHDRIERPSEVALYRAVMADGEGEPTHTLLRGTHWLVDDRLLPLGWSAEHPEARRTAPAGLGSDADFVGGSDRVRYAVTTPPEGTLEVELLLLYQTVGARWAAELFEWETPEVAAFREQWLASDRRPQVLARGRARVPER